MCPQLRKSERKVAALVLSRPHAVVNAPIATVADDAAVSEPTAIRFCRSLDILESVRSASDSGTRVIGITAAGSPLAERCTVTLFADAHEDTDLYPHDLTYRALGDTRRARRRGGSA